MELMKKVQQFILGLVVLLAFGCGEDDDKKVEPKPEIPALKLDSIARISGLYEFHTKLYYDAQGRVTGVTEKNNTTEFPDDSLTYAYNAAGKIAKVTFYNENGVSYYHYTQNFNSKGLLTERTMVQTMANGSVSNTHQIFTYNSANKPIQVNYLNDQQQLVGSTTISYPAANTAIMEGRKIINGAPGPFSGENTEYTFDTMKGVLQLMDNRAFYTLMSGGNPLIMKKISNGILKENTTFSYIYNLSGFPTEQKLFLNSVHVETITYFYK